VKTATVAVLFASLVLAGCGSAPSPATRAARRAECDAGTLTSCHAAGLHPQVFSDDAAIAAGIDAALRDAVDAGIAMRLKRLPQRDAQGPQRHALMSP